MQFVLVSEVFRLEHLIFNQIFYEEVAHKAVFLENTLYFTQSA